MTRLKVSPLALLAYLLVMTLLCSLGVWQLRRADEKRLYLQAIEQAGQTSTVLDLNASPQLNLATAVFQKIRASGHYDVEHQFLIDNQIRNGKAGFLVLTPFLLDGGEPRAVLVNRGWLVGQADRRSLPEVSIGDVVTQVSGRANQLPVPGLKLKGAETPTESWPAVVQWPDVSVMAAKLGYPLLDFQLELADDQPAGYQRQWQTTAAIPPEKHMAYAVQWFGLALTLTALFLWMSSKQNR